MIGIQPKTIKKVEDVIRKAKEINKTNLIKESGIHSWYLDRILDDLEKEGKVVIVKVERVKDNKPYVVSMKIKWTKSHKSK
jgi:predicted transcriptional regulator